MEIDQKNIASTANATQPIETLPPSKKILPFKLIGIIVAVLFLVAVVVFVMANLLGKNKETATSGEIVWWGLWEDESVVKPVISTYEAKNPNIKIKYIRQSKEDYRERLTTALAKGTGPDIFRFHNTWTPMFKSELDKMPSFVYSPTDFTSNFYPVHLSDMSLGTSIVGVPLEYDGLTLYMNEEIFEKAGKGYPTTWNELRQVARELTIKDETGQITQACVAL